MSNNLFTAKFSKSAVSNGTFKAVVIEQSEGNGLYHNVNLYQSANALNAATEYINGLWTIEGRVHVASGRFSKSDVTQKIYVGDNMVKRAKREGVQTVPVIVNGKLAQVFIPDSLDMELVGTWTLCYRRDDFNWTASACQNIGHKVNQDAKHDVLKSLAAGSKLVVYTDIALTKGEVDMRGQLAVQKFLDEWQITPKDGEAVTLKADENVAMRHLEGYLKYDDGLKKADKVATVTDAVFQKAVNQGMEDTRPADVATIPVGNVAVALETVKGTFAVLTSEKVYVQRRVYLDGSRETNLISLKKFARNGFVLESVE